MVPNPKKSIDALTSIRKLPPETPITALPVAVNTLNRLMLALVSEIW